MSRLPATGLCKSSPCSDVECGKDLDSRSPRVPASLVFGDSMKPGTISRVWHRAGAPNDSPRTAELTTRAGLSATCPVSFTEPAQPVLWATLLYRCFNDLKTHSVIQPNALLSTYYVSQTLTGLRKIGLGLERPSGPAGGTLADWGNWLRPSPPPAVGWSRGVREGAGHGGRRYLRICRLHKTWRKARAT